MKSFHGLKGKFEVKQCSNHLQSVETVVNLATNDLFKVCGFDRKGGYIRAGIASSCGHKS